MTTNKIGEPCPKCGTILTDYNGMPVCAECYEKAFNMDIVCEHGTAMDVHCCNCHSGFLFDINQCICLDKRNETI